jgi:hypothetical protein
VDIKLIELVQYSFRYRAVMNTVNKKLGSKILLASLVPITSHGTSCVLELLGKRLVVMF